jgi:hypothetical protein
MISTSFRASAAAALLLLGLSACDSSSSTDPVVPPVAPTVLSTVPAGAASGIARNGSVSATFSVPMDPAFMTATTFTLAAGGTPVLGTVSLSGATAVFRPAVQLAASATFTATITTGAKSAAGLALGAAHTWTFATGTTVTPEAAVALGTAGGFAILAKSGISTVPPSVITGDIGVSPVAATGLTGFTLTADTGNAFATSTQVTGKVYAATYAAPTPANLTAAVADMQLAFTDAAGRAAGVTELGAGDIGGRDLPPGVYKWGTGLLIPTDVTLTGSATGVWIFQVAQDLTLANGARVVLAGGALPKNVFWQVSGLVSVGTTSHLAGVVLSQTSIGVATGGVVQGRLLAQTAVTLDTATVTQPAP